jgi:hypothetical protein
MDDSLSDASEVKCHVPYIQSLASIDTFTIDAEGSIIGDHTAAGGGLLQSSTSMGGLAFDGDNVPGPTSTGSNCYMGTMFEGDATGYFVGKLTEFRFFMDYFSDKSKYQNNLMLQGSNTGAWTTTDTTDVWTVDDELHEGWNYYKLEDLLGVNNLPKFRYYRLFNAQSNGCDAIGEITFVGWKAFDSTASTHSCAIVVSGDGYLDNDVTLAANVLYDVSSTPYVTDISPRYGNIFGGTTVTFTGVNFSATSSDYTILIDGNACAVTGTPTTTEVQCITS